jgi:hypothetical protein
MVGANSLTRLHRRLGLRQGAMRGRRRVKKKNHNRSRWSRGFSKGCWPRDDEEDCWPMRPTPRTAHAKNHHSTCLAYLLPHRASSVCATTDQGQPVRIWYATRSKKSVRQLLHPAASLIHLLNWQRSRARVLGLDGQTKPLSRWWRKESDTKEEKGSGCM